MKYYSEKLNKVFDTPEACESAEFEAKEKENLEKVRKEREARELKEKKEKETAERKAAADKVDNARKAMVAAQKEYRDALNEFVDKYHTYHYSTNNAEEVPFLFGLFNDIFKL